MTIPESLPGHGLQPPSLWCNLVVSGHCNAEQLVSPDHHIVHFKGVAVFHKSVSPLCLNALMVVSPHGLMAVSLPFQLSLSPEAAFAEPTGSFYPLLQSPGTVSISELAISSMDESESDEA